MITMVRNKHSKELKLQVIKEARESSNVAAVARRYELATNMVHRWVREFEDGKFGIHHVDQIESVEHKQVLQENDQLKKLLGEQALEIAILRDLVKKKNPHLLKNLK